MFNKILVFVLFLALLPDRANSQTKEHIEAINDVWAKFYQAFDSLDYTLMAEIHSKDLVRVSGGKKISDYETYINNYQRRFMDMQAKNVTNTISLRFFERVNNDIMASERGVYKLIRNKDRPDEKAYYGQFHVIFKKEDGEWKILMDYDSNYENSIGEEDYLESHAIDEYRPFIKE